MELFDSTQARIEMEAGQMMFFFSPAKPMLYRSLVILVTHPS